MNNDNKVETAIEGLNRWACYATAYLWNDTLSSFASAPVNIVRIRTMDVAKHIAKHISSLV